MLKLPFLEKFLPGKELAKEPILAIEIAEQKKVKVAIWQLEKGEPKIKAQAIKKFSGEWEAVVPKLAELVFDLNKQADFKTKPEKVIFGLPKSFVDGDKIKDSYLLYLKKLCQKTSLTPLGFVEIPQAISFFLKEKRDRSQGLVLLKIYPHYFLLNIFDWEKEVVAEKVSSEKNIGVALAEVLKKQAKLKSFPSTIILYNGEEDLEEIKQELLSYPWQKSAGFVHFPKVKILTEDFSLKALVTAGAKEFGEQILTVKKKEPEKKELKVDQKEVSSQVLGFLKEKDIVEEKAKLEEEDKEKEFKEEELEEEEFEEEKPELNKEKEPEKEAGGFFDSIAWPAIFEKMSFKKAILPALILIIIGTGILFYTYWYYPQAKIEILVESQSLEEDAEITLDLSLASPGEDLSHLPGKEVSLKKRGSDKIGVSSKKEVGDPAQGEVTVYNKTTNEKSFPKGTVLVGPEGLKFTLDEEIKVASLSDVIAGTPGQKKVKVTASEIGPEGNLAAGSDFTFEDFPVTSYAARNEKAFSGGTSREVTVVGEKDQQDLFSLLKEKLTKEAEKELEESLDSSEKLLAETIESKIVEKKFSHDIGEEASELTLDLVIDFKGVAYNQDHLTTLLRKMAEESVPSGYQFDKEKIEMEVISIEKEKDKTVFKAHFKVELTPKIDQQELKKKLAGKKFKEVESYFRQMANISGYEIKSFSCFPLTKKTLPFNPQRISIEILPH